MMCSHDGNKPPFMSTKHIPYPLRSYPSLTHLDWPLKTLIPEYWEFNLSGGGARPRFNIYTSDSRLVGTIDHLTTGVLFWQQRIFTM